MRVDIIFSKLTYILLIFITYLIITFLLSLNNAIYAAPDARDMSYAECFERLDKCTDPGTRDQCIDDNNEDSCPIVGSLDAEASIDAVICKNGRKCGQRQVDVYNQYGGTDRWDNGWEGLSEPSESCKKCLTAVDEDNRSVNPTVPSGQYRVECLGKDENDEGICTEVEIGNWESHIIHSKHGIDILFFSMLPGGFGCELAQPSWAPGYHEISRCGYMDIPKYIKQLFVYGSMIFGGLAMIKIIIAGYMYAVSAGNTKIVSEAKSHLFYAIVGILLIVLTNFILYLFGAVRL